MVFEVRRPSTHNEMLGRHSNRTHKGRTTLNQTEGEPPAKRVKRSETEDDETQDLGDQQVPPSPKTRSRIIPDSEAESEDEELKAEEDTSSYRTDLEQALPQIKTDKEAIEEYETLRAAESGDLNERLGKRQWVRGKSSIYVDAFNLALETVLEDESHLFDEAEIELFDQWRNLSYEAQYLLVYVRLFLRKTSAWHRANRLRYYSDIADMQTAIDELLIWRSLPNKTTEAQISPGELAPPEGTTLGDKFTFAECSDDHISSLEEASSLLSLDELKNFAKEAKVQGKNKSELLKAFRRASGRQTALGFASLKRSETEDSTFSEAPDSREESPTKNDTLNRDTHFTQKILAETGQCVRLSLAPLKLFERVHLVFYRSTQWTEKSLITIILARIARWNFPEYIVSRSTNIFPSRSLLLEFEASLRTQFRVDSILEFNGTPTLETLQSILDMFDEIYPRWQVLLEEEQRKEDSIYLSGEGAYLRRLSPAWVYTRIVHKAAYVLGLGKFKEYNREHSLLSELLQQRLFHASRRGSWYQRKALLEEHYMHALRPSEGRSFEAQKKHWKRIALQTCEQGLQDNLVHHIYHYDLQKRLRKLEKSLKIAKREQHEFRHVALEKPLERTVEGIRVERNLPLRRESSNGTFSKGTGTSLLPRRSGKTIWLDPREDNTECSVEAMCLSWYRDNGWKGYHSEGGILRTLFAYLFFEVLFTYVPNVFQTSYQTCPLDLHTDAFYATRISEMNARLAEISNGCAEKLIRDVWNTHFEKRTCIIGLNWSFELEDLVEIAQCFSGDQLATICKVMAQEYGERGGGIPDLFLWSTERKEVCFSEVKSENDRLSDTQRLWIHVLTGAGVKVELCHAVAKEVITRD